MPRRSGRERLELLRSIDGIETRTAQTIIGEIGVDMTRFASAGHLASWAGRCPGNHESAGKRRSGLTRHGSTWLDDALKDAAMAAIRTNDRYLQAQSNDSARASATAPALGAVKHSILCACWHVLSHRRALPRPLRRYCKRRDSNARPDASSPISNASDSPSPCRKPPERDRISFRRFLTDERETVSPEQLLDRRVLGAMVHGFRALDCHTIDGIAERAHPAARSVPGFARAHARRRSEQCEEA
ncbi:MAG TPA: IS110 family transposase [Solirubrobacteraceae bacterium]|jgi:hypothetical protein